MLKKKLERVQDLFVTKE